MHAYLAESVPKARFKEVSRVLVQRLARRAQDFVNDRWSSSTRRMTPQFFSFALLALTFMAG
jgi:hypothetical protein